MNSRRYWKNRIPFLLTNLICMVALIVFLLVCGNSISVVLLILVVWAVVLLSGLFLTYWKRKQQMQKLLDMAGWLSERYLISEVMELPEQAEDQVYYQLLKMAGKSMLEQIGEVRRERLEYKEYIEQWIHEIKTPITAMKLLCENHRTVHSEPVDCQRSQVSVRAAGSPHFRPQAAGSGVPRGGGQRNRDFPRRPAARF